MLCRESRTPLAEFGPGPFRLTIADGLSFTPGLSLASGFVACVAGGLGVYVGVFVILFLDAMVWKTNYADRWIPTACHVPLRIFFYPLLLICHWMGWLPGGMPPVR